eukprot:s179_g19.t1
MIIPILAAGAKKSLQRAALMACGRVLQWIKAGEDAFCWLTSAEAVWVAQQFLHGAVCTNGTASSVLPDEATREAVSRWRERRRAALATPGPRGDWQLPTDEELDLELLNDQTIQAAKVDLQSSVRVFRSQREL